MATFRDYEEARLNRQSRERDSGAVKVAPLGGRADSVLAVQRTAGNAAVRRMIAADARPVLTGVW